MRGPSYDWASVDRLLHQRWPALGVVTAISGEAAYGSLGLPELLGMSKRTVQSSRARGFMDTTMADAVATKLGVHPSLIWLTWFEDAEQEPRCKWCRAELAIGDQAHSVTCSKPCRLKLKAERDLDMWRLYAFERRCDRIRERLDRMTPAELDAWLGIEHIEAMAA